MGRRGRDEASTALPLRSGWLLRWLQGHLGGPEGAGGEQLAGEAVQDRPQPEPELRRHGAARARLPAERLGSDLKADDVEACVVRNDNLNFTRLSGEEIETQLTALAERDDDLVSRE